MSRFAALALFLSGCLRWEPDVNRIPSPEGEGVAVEITKMYLEREHGELPDHDGDIVWTDDGCIPVDWRGVTGCPRGAYYSGDGTIYLAFDGTIWDSALTHELIHYWLDATGDSDHDHERLDWWDMVEPIKEKIMAWEESK